MPWQYIFYDGQQTGICLLFLRNTGLNSLIGKLSLKGAPHKIDVIFSLNLLTSSLNGKNSGRRRAVSFLEDCCFIASPKMLSWVNKSKTENWKLGSSLVFDFQSDKRIAFVLNLLP